jgi:hypothetical protein
MKAERWRWVLSNPLVLREVEASRIYTGGTWRWQGCQPYSPAAFTPRDTSRSHFFTRLRRLQGHCAAGRIKSGFTQGFYTCIPGTNCVARLYSFSAILYYYYYYYYYYWYSSSEYLNCSGCRCYCHYSIFRTRLILKFVNVIRKVFKLVSPWHPWTARDSNCDIVI